MKRIILFLTIFTVIYNFQINATGERFSPDAEEALRRSQLFIESQWCIIAALILEKQTWQEAYEQLLQENQRLQEENDQLRNLHLLEVDDHEVTSDLLAEAQAECMQFAERLENAAKHIYLVEQKNKTLQQNNLALRQDIDILTRVNSSNTWQLTKYRSKKP